MHCWSLVTYLISISGNPCGARRSRERARDGPRTLRCGCMKTQRVARDCVHEVQTTVHTTKQVPARLNALPRDPRAFPRRKCCVPGHVPLLGSAIYFESVLVCSQLCTFRCAVSPRLQKRRQRFYSDLYTIQTHTTLQ